MSLNEEWRKTRGWIRGIQLRREADTVSIAIKAPDEYEAMMFFDRLQKRLREGHLVLTLGPDLKTEVSFTDG